MKADLSRSTFDPDRQYKRVRLQQGRVQTDADANEQVDIVFHRAETEAADLIGGCGGPIQGAGFGLTSGGDDVIIGPGRYYVGGVLVENPDQVGYREQPHLPLSEEVLEALGLPRELAMPEDGRYLAYLDVWEWHRTALEVPSIREVALGGPDTASRTQVVWQVRLHPIEEEEADCVSEIPSWTRATAPSTGHLGARAEVAAASADPCIVAPGAGYRRLENQLYRVEVHEGGDRNASTYKWDRDNGTVLARLEAQSEDLEEWTLSSVGRDAVLRFAPGDWAEITDDTHELHGLPGTLVRVSAVEGNVLTVDLGERYPAGGAVRQAAFPVNAKVRRWNGVLSRVTNQDFRELEEGVQVRLRGGNGPDGEPRRYHTGDYWTIPARTNTGDVEWPTENDGWVPAEGILHHYCRLGLGTLAGEWDAITDCRHLFPPVTQLTSLDYVGGDGQEGAPNQSLRYRLEVGVANGSHPVEGARVMFGVRAGGGRVNGLPSTTVPTDADGVASVAFRLGSEGQQIVEARLLDAAGDPVHLPIRFSADIEGLTLDYVGGDGQHGSPGEDLPAPLQVGVSRGSAPVAGETVRFRVMSGGGQVNGLAGTDVLTTAEGLATADWTLGPDGEQRVEAVLLGGGGAEIHLPVRFAAQLGGPSGEDPGFHVVDLRWQSDGSLPLRNDTTVGLDELGTGLAIEFDSDVAPEAVRGGPSQGSNFAIAKPVCVLTVHMPYPLSESERELWNWQGRNRAGFGTQGVRLSGRLSVEGRRMFWQPAPEVGLWITDSPFSNAFEGAADRVLCELTLKGDKLWAADREPRVYLDGEAYGRPRPADDGTDVEFPSGDRRLGSDLEMWFWLVRQREAVGPVIAAEPETVGFTGIVPIGGRATRTLTVRNDGDAPLTISGVEVGPDVFAIGDAPGRPIPPGRQDTITVGYMPDGERTSGQLTITSDATNAATLVLPVQAQTLTRGTRLQFIHAASDTGQLTVTLDDEPFPSARGTHDYRYQMASPQHPVFAGTRLMTLTDANGEVVLQEALELEPGVAYTVAVTRQASRGGLALLVTEGVRRSGSGSGVDLLVVNALESETEAIEVAHGRGENRLLLADNLPSGGRAEHIEMEAGRRTLDLRVGDDQFSTRFDLRSRAGEAVVVLAVGDPGARDARLRPTLLAYDADGTPVTQIDR